MYYYIFESPKNSTERAYFEKIKDTAREFSIINDSAQASPARSCEELTEMAIAKQYSTIIAVGSDNHINRVVSQIVKSRPTHSLVFGLISTDQSSLLYERWGFKRPEDACEMLKFRKVEPFDIGLVAPDHFFLSSASITTKKPTRVFIEIDRFKVEAMINHIEVSNNLYVLLERFIKDTSLVRSILGWISGQENVYADRSVFKGRIIKISSQEKLTVKIADYAVSHTPVEIYRKHNGLNIITKRDRVIQDKLENRRIT